MAHSLSRKIRLFIKDSQSFTLRVVLCRTVLDRVKSTKLPDAIKAPLWELYHELILKFLTNTYQPIIEKYKGADLPEDARTGGTIWTCWWQGEANATPLVKKCIQNMREKAGNHPVVVIDKDNWSDYVKVPELIMEKFRAGTITNNKLANVIRIALLNTYGGLWLDATVYTFRQIPEDIFSMPFFTSKQIRQRKPRRFVSQTGEVDLWATSVLGGRAGHPLFRFMLTYFPEYWKLFSRDITYLWFDYGIRMAYENLPAVKRDVDAVPVNCPNCFGLWHMLNDAYSKEAVRALAASDTLFFKLGHEGKCHWKTHTDSGEETVYFRFIQENGFGDELP